MLLAPFYLRRALGIWVVCRLATAMVMPLADGDPLRLPARAAIFLVVVSVALCLVDVARNRERAMLGNFGIGRTQIAFLCAIPAMLGEVAVAVLAGGAP